MPCSTSCGLVPFLGLAAGVEVALPFHRGLVGKGFGGHFLAQHQALVEPARPRGKNLGQDLQRIGVAVPERHRVPEDVHLRVGLGLGVHALLGQLLDFERHDIRRRLRPARDALEVLLRQRLGLGRLEIAHEDERDVLRRVIGRVELVGLRLGDGREVRRPADDRPGVRRATPRTSR